MNLIGKRFERLVVLPEESGKRGYVVCKCDCGKRVVVRATSLRNKKTRSCGCLQREVMSKIGRKTIRDNSIAVVTANTEFHTNFSVIEREKPHKNNKSGYKGVWLDKKTGKYYAYITVHKRQINLGHFDNIIDAVIARKRAEEQFFQPLIDAKHKLEGRTA